MNQARRQPLTEDEFLDLLSGYVFAALEPEENAEVEEYLNARPEMLPRLQDLEQIVAQMAYAVPPAAPSIETKAHIMDRARLDAQPPEAVAPRVAQKHPSASSPLTRTPLTRQIRRNTRQPNIAPDTVPKQFAVQESSRQPQQLFVQEETFFERIRNWFTYAMGWKVFALGTTATVAFLAINFFGAQELANQTTARFEALQGTVTSLEGELAQRQVDNQTLQGEITSLQGKVVTLQDKVIIIQGQASVLQTSNEKLTETVSALQTQADTLEQVNEVLEEQLQAQQTQFASLSNVDSTIAVAATGDGSENARGTLFLSEEQGTFVLTGLDPLPADQTYQLWVAAADQPIVSAGLVPLADGPTTAFAFSPPIPAAEITVVGLSVEPLQDGEGSETPTGPIVLFTQ